jgi:DNA-binding transcriptional regulator YiaG
MRRDLVAKWRASGLSQAEFCRREGLEQWQLSEWKRLEAKHSEANSDEGVQGANRATPRRGRKTRAELERYWKQVIANHAASGLSAPKFCKKYGVNINTLKRWRSIFGSKRSQKKEFRAAAKSPPAVNPFVEVALKYSETACSPEHSLEIVLPGGSLIRVTSRTPLGLLSKVLTALEDKC